MDIKIMPDKAPMGKAAAAAGAEHIRRAIAERGAANIIIATRLPTSKRKSPT